MNNTEPGGYQMLVKTLLALMLVISTSKISVAGEILADVAKVTGVVCESDEALREHYSKLPEVITLDDHRKVLSQNCKFLEASAIYTIKSISRKLLIHNNEIMVIGGLNLWPTGNKLVYGVIRVKSLGNPVEL